MSPHQEPITGPHSLLSPPSLLRIIWINYDLGWFIHQLEVRICFGSSSAWPPTSCTWAFPLCIIILYGELIPSSFLNSTSPPNSNKPLVSIKPPPPWNVFEINKPLGGLNRGFTVSYSSFFMPPYISNEKLLRLSIFSKCHKNPLNLQLNLGSEHSHFCQAVESGIPMEQKKAV